MNKVEIFISTEAEIKSQELLLQLKDARKELRENKTTRQWVWAVLEGSSSVMP